LASAAFSPMSHFKAVNAAFMERTPFAIDDAGDDDDDSDLDMVHGEDDDDQVLDEVSGFAIGKFSTMLSALGGCLFGGT
jgi:TBC1 domain family member 8/9